MRKVITGYSSKEDGFLIITDRELSEVAVGMGMVHKTFDDQDLFVDPDRLIDGELSGGDATNIADSETPRGVYRVFVAEFKLDENLSGAVCW